MVQISIVLLLSILICSPYMESIAFAGIQFQISDEPLIALAWRADGAILAIANREEAWLYTAEGQPITQLNIDTEQRPYYLEWHPSTNQLALGTSSRASDERVYVWDISGDPESLSITLERVIVMAEIGLGGMAWSPDSRLAVSYGPSEIYIWETADGSFIQTLSPEANAAIDGIAWSADGQRLAAGMADRNVRIWDMTSYPYQLIHTLNNEGAGPAGEIVWSPSHNALAVVQTDGIFIWEYNTDTLSYQQTITLSESTEIVRRLKWGSNRLAALAADHIVYVWNSNSWELEASFQGGGGSGSVLALAVSPDGSHVAYSGEDGSLTTVTPLPFSDAFEFGDYNWATTGNWALDDTESHSNSHAFKDTRTEVSGYDSTLTLNWPLDLSATTTPELTSWTRLHLTQYETGYVEVSTDDGTTWQPVQQVQWSNLGWTRQRVDLSGYAGQQIRLRFRMDGADCTVPQTCPPGVWCPQDIPNDCPFDAEWWLDDIQVAEANTVTFDASFTEDFEAGTDNWITEGTWAANPEGAYGGSGLSANDSPGVFYAGWTSTALELDGILDLSGSGLVLPALRYWSYYDLGSDGHAYVEVSTDDGVTWVTLQDVYNATSPSWTEQTLDLSAYSGQPMRLRFRLDVGSQIDLADGWRIDDISIVDLAHPLPFSDDFQSGPDNWTTTGQWLWTILQIPPGHYRVMRASSQGGSSTSLLTLEYPVAASTPSQLSYWTSVSLQSMSHVAYVEASVDNGQSWTTVDTLTYSKPFTGTRTANLPTPQGQGVLVRFRLYTSTQFPTSTWYVDDITVQ